MPDLTKLTDDKFMEKWTTAAAKLETLKEELRDYAAEHDRRNLTADAEARVASMTEAEKKMLAQTLQADGIESEETVNK